MSTHLLLVDDHPVVRQGIRQILAEALDPAVVDEAESGEAALTALEGHPCDAVILDITLPGRSGLDVLREIRTVRPELPVLILSMHPADEFARRAIEGGASGYVTKDTAPAQLVKAVRLVLAGRRYLTPEIIEDLVAEGHPPQAGRLHDSLSDREYQVMRLVAAGRTIAQISTTLSLSAKTVSTYRSRVLEKMRMRTTAELMRYAIENKLLD